MKKPVHKKYAALILFLLAVVQPLTAQSSADVLFRSSQKFYVSVAVIFIILFGFIAFLFYLERKAKAIQNRIESFTKK